MKKIFAIIASFALMWGFVSPIPVAMAGSSLDQACDIQDIWGGGGTGYWIIKSHYRVQQTFSPSVNRLTSVRLAISAEQSKLVTFGLRLLDDNDQLVATTSASTSFPLINWLEFEFDPVVEVDTTKQYKLFLSTTFDDAYWGVATTDYCSGGNAFVDSSPNLDQDFGYLTYGYNVDPPAEPAGDSEDGGGDGEGNEEAVPTPTQNSETESDNELKETDESIGKPILTKLEINGEVAEFETDKPLSLTAGEKVVLSGTTEKGTGVVVVWGLETYEATVNDDGTWSLEIVPEETEEALLVTGQATKDDVGSELTEFLSVLVASAQTTKTSVVEKESPNYTLTYILLGIAGIVLGGSGIGGYYYWKKKKKSPPTSASTTQKEKKEDK